MDRETRVKRSLSREPNPLDAGCVRNHPSGKRSADERQPQIPRTAATAQDAGTPYDDNAAGGWGSLRGVARIFGESASSTVALKILSSLNKPKGVMCSSCAWAKPAEPHTFEFCENGAKATLWELDARRASPEFFQEHPLAELQTWHDHKLETSGRLTHPLRYDPATDRYVAVGWADAFR